MSTIFKKNKSMKNIILICGPSGAGKDTLIREARKYFASYPRVNFVKRYITRPPDEFEDNFFVCEQGFNILMRSNFFLVTWKSYGYYYGIPEYLIREDCCNFISVSRKTISFFEEKFKNVFTIYVTADYETIKKRLTYRNREDMNILKQRLDRYSFDVEAKNKIVFKNQGPIEVSVENFISLCSSIISNFLDNGD